MTSTNAIDLSALVLKRGAHAKNNHGDACLMEAVSYFNNEKWSDRPACTCPVLTSFGIRLNDSWSDEDRQRLVPFIPKLVGTRSTPAVEHKRSMMALDWLIRFYAGAWLELVPSLKADADALRSLAPIVDLDTAKAAGVIVKPARDRAAAAGDAAGDAAVAIYTPTVKRCQDSALELFERMIAVVDEDETVDFASIDMFTHYDEAGLPTFISGAKAARLFGAPR